MSGSDGDTDDGTAVDGASSHVMGAKIGIIVGLFFLTLFAALLPLICVMLADRRRRRKEFYGGGSAATATGGGGGGLCGIFRGKAGSAHTEQNGAVGRSRSLRKRMSSVKLNKRQSKRLLSCLNCFSGGIFLGTSLIGMLPEVREIFNAQNIGWTGKNVVETFPNGTIMEHHGEEEEEAGGHGGKLLPLAELVTAAGLFFILSIEQCAHVYNHWRLKRKKQRDAAAQHENIILGGPPNTVISAANNGASSGHHKPGGASNEEPGTKIELQTSSSKRLMSEAASTVEHQEDIHHDQHEIRSLMLVASLSIHSFLEGIAMGLQKKVASLTAIFVAVLFHKSLMAFSMGTNLVRAKQSRNRVFAASLIFALMSPVGMITGLIIESYGGNQDTENIPNAVFQAVATGTFLYITFFEVLVREFEASGDRLFKVCSLILGFTAVTMTIYAHHL